MRNTQKTVALTIIAAPLSPTVTPFADGKTKTPPAAAQILAEWTAEKDNAHV